MRVSISTLVAGLLSAQASLAEPISLFGIDMTMSNSEIRAELESRGFNCTGRTSTVEIRCSRERNTETNPRYGIRLFDTELNPGIEAVFSDFYGDRMISISCAEVGACALADNELQRALERELGFAMQSFRFLSGVELPSILTPRIECVRGDLEDFICTDLRNGLPKIWIFQGRLGTSVTPLFE